jgi:hypothetical protein
MFQDDSEQEYLEITVTTSLNNTRTSTYLEGKNLELILKLYRDLRKRRYSCSCNSF